MKELIKIVCAIALFNSSVVNAQNLVPNPSFEDTISCPTSLADLLKVTYWTSPSQGSPDYFNACNNNDVSVPNNIFGNQFALTGNGYIGISVYDDFDTYSYREYIQVPLMQTLISGVKYWVSFYVSLADSSDYAIKELGAYFSSSQINYSMDTTLSFTPQVEFIDSVITDKINWIRVYGSFIANGNESYLIIGNFNRKQTTTMSQVSNNNITYSYYFIDEVCVSNDSLTCNQFTTVQEQNINLQFNLFPNPTINNIIINSINNEKYDLYIYNELGEELYEETNILDHKHIVNVTEFSSGLLLIQIKTRNQIINYKTLKL